MTQVGSVYGEALYELAKGEGLQESILEELKALNESFRQEPGFIQLLSSHAISKQERCKVLDDSFRGKINQYVLNFLKILTEKGYMHHFSHCCESYEKHYNEDHNILSVKAVTAVPLSEKQAQALTQKLTRTTGKTIVRRTGSIPRAWAVSAWTTMGSGWTIPFLTEWIPSGNC